MGFYYGQTQPPEEKEPGGCRDVLILTRVVFGVLFLPLAVMIGVILGLVLVIYLWSISWLLGLLAILLIAIGVGVYARWERTRYRRAILWLSADRVEVREMTTVQSWQYITQVFTDLDLQRELDDLGRGGWELVTAQWEEFTLGGRMHMQARCILKRPAPGETEFDEADRYERVGIE